jgi:hypothetical protein
MPHSAFDGQTPDEVGYETGTAVPRDLAKAREAARQARIATNKTLTCEICRPPPDSTAISGVLQSRRGNSGMS